MTSQSYLVLNSWLQKSDQNYIDGRFLWLNKRINSACNLLWLSLEQMIKILLVQSEIDKMLKGSTNLEKSHVIVDLKCKKLGHRIQELLIGINQKYSDIDIFRFENQLEKLNEYFFRRYVVHEVTSIAVTMSCDIDELYFALRDKVDPDIGIGTIDQIFIAKPWV